MSVSDQEYQAWLADIDQPRVLLIEATHSGQTEYFASKPFLSEPTDADPNRPYDDFGMVIPEFITSIDGNVSIGRLGVKNIGDLDHYLELAWRGWPLNGFLGAPGWSRDDYRLILSGINGGVRAPQNDRVSFELRDKRELLNVPVQTSLLANGDPVPLALGDSLLNIEPVLINPATLHYQWHENGNGTLSVVRDKGNPVGFTDNLDGTFNLTAQNVGRVTCDVIGETSGTAAVLVNHLALRAPSISASDIDSDNLAAYPNSDKLGLYVRSRRTILELIRDIMQSSGGTAFFSILGKLQLVRLDLPGTPVLELDLDDIASRNGITIQEVEQPRAQIQLHYARNWTPQDADSLAAIVTPANRELYSREWQIVTATNSGVSTDYPLAESPPPVDTLIISQAQAQAEANRRAALRESKRFVYRIRGFAAPFQLELGQTVRIHHPKWGFDNGKNAVVIETAVSPTRNRVNLEVWE